MAMIEKNVLDCLPETITTQFDFSGVYTDKEGHQHNVTVFDTSYFVMMLQQLHATRNILVNETNPSAHFVSLFTAWKNSRKDLFIKQAYAYTLKYNPIENYSSIEQMIDDTTEHMKGASFKDDFHNTDTTKTTPYDKIKQETTPYETKTETIPYDTKVETTPHEIKVETTPYDTKVETTPYTKEETTTTPQNDATTTSVKGFNSSNWSESEKVERSGSVKETLQKTGKETVDTTHNNSKETVETTYNNTKETVKTTHENTKETVETTHNDTKETIETTYTGTETHETSHTGYIEHTTDGTDTDTRNYTLTKSGNIGVMTASQMLQSEYDGLRQDLAFRAYSEFIDRFTYYNEGWW